MLWEGKVKLWLDQIPGAFVINGDKALIRLREETLNSLLDAEADRLVNAERYAHDEERQGYRSGHYDRNFTTTSGDVNLRVPKLKGLTFETAIDKDSQQYWMEQASTCFI